MPSPDSLNARGWPSPALDATSTLASGWPGKGATWKLAPGAAENSIVLGAMATKCSSGIDALGIDIHAAGVGNGVDDIESRLAGTKRKQEGVAIFGIPPFGNGSGLYRLAAGGHGLALGDLCAIGHVELEVVLVHLGARRLGGVGHREGAFDLELSLTGLKAHDVGDDLDAFDFLADIVDFDRDGSRSRRGHSVIGDFLMNHADQVRALGVELETEITFGVGSGAAGFFHALTEAEQDHFVAGGGLAGGGVLHRAGQGLGGGEGGEKDESNKDCHKGDMWRQPPSAVGPDKARQLRARRECRRAALDWTAEGGCPHMNTQDDRGLQGMRSFHGLVFLGADAALASRRAISARSVAASSCSDAFRDW